MDYEVFEPIKREPDDNLGLDRYHVCCPECGSQRITFSEVVVRQGTVTTRVKRDNETVDEDQNSPYRMLSGAMIELNCHCPLGHRFDILFRHGEPRTVASISMCATQDPDSLPELWKKE